jgi:anti-sigma regulatory factor (Ser/Thr protein kinase)
VEPVLASVALARAAIRSALAASTPELAERAATCGSELVANAIRHGAPPVLLSITERADHTVIAVEDGDGAPPVLRRSENGDVTGRGLPIVVALSERWGVEFLPHGKRVWCLFGPVPGPG